MLIDGGPGLDSTRASGPGTDVSSNRVRAEGLRRLSIAAVIVSAGVASASASGAEPEALFAGAVKSRLVVLKTVNGQAVPPIVILGKPAGASEIPDMRESRLDILPREFVRQAMLIAARDGLGLSTRDEVIDDTPAAEIGRDGAAGVVEVVSWIRGPKSREMARKVADGGAETLLSHETAIDPVGPIEMVTLLTSAEALSREGFPKVLKAMGLEGKPNAVKADLGVSAEVEKQLSGLGFPETVSALRAIHEEIRTEGESPARIGALVRGYAQLGVLSEFHWHPAHKAYKARSLLYAQRLLATGGEGPWGLWHRAFALTLTGRHKDALADLAAAAKTASAKDAPKAPAWVEIIEARARYDSTKLAAAFKNGPHAKLAALLRMTTLEFPQDSATGPKVAQAVVALDSSCFRATDMMCDFQALSTLQYATALGPDVLAKNLPDKIRLMPNLPASVRKRIEGRPAASVLAEVLDRAGDPADDRGEPSWGALAHLIRETRFVQVWRRLMFLKHMLVVPAGDYWNEVMLDVAGHRYRPYLETLVLPPGETAEPFAAFVDQVDLAEIGGNDAAMVRAMGETRRPRGVAAFQVTRAHDDEVARDLSVALGLVPEGSRPALAGSLLTISPNDTFARALLLQDDWAHAKGNAETWEKESGESTVVLHVLANRYAGEKRYDDARRVLEKYIEKSPDFWSYGRLAETYKAQGRIDRWQETLEDYLKKVADLGLDHARVRVDIANYYMSIKDWEKAKPYAEQAATSWAEWAMRCAARCAEGERDWQRAEAWCMACAQRYPNTSTALWYFYCRRTGEGDLEGARALVERQIAGFAEGSSQEYAGYFYWADGRIDQAKAAFLEDYRKTSSASAGLALALIADGEKDTARRDELLRELCGPHRRKAPLTFAICQMFLDTIYAPGGNKPLDVASLKRQIDAFPVEGKGNAEFTFGWLLLNHGDRDLAKAYLQGCVDSPKTMDWYRFLAQEALKKLTTD